MGAGVTTKKLWISGMTCSACEHKIETKLRNTPGIQRAQVSYAAGTARVAYDPEVISLREIARVVRNLGYELLPGEPGKAPPTSRIVGSVFAVAALYFLLQHFGLLQLFGSFQVAEKGMGYGMLFVIGLTTSLHCVAMCGGINLSQCVPRQEGEGGRANLRPSFLYNLGRVVSYTLVGGVVGALGSVISFSGAMRGAVQLAAGVFMVVMGINMLGIFPWLRKFNPRLPKFLTGGLMARKENSKSPLIVGMLNGLMPCGPLQAMQIYALSTGSAVTGALSMLIFSLGTVPLMFGLGALSSILSKKFTGRAMAAGAVLVVVLGISMLTSGWTLSGFASAAGPEAPGQSEAAPTPTPTPDVQIENGVQVVNSRLTARKYPSITVQAGVPVKWNIRAPQGSITGCNNRMVIPEYGIEYTFATGDNVIEFTPAKAGKFSYSCWMGMLRGTITVTEADESVLPAPVQTGILPTADLPADTEETAEDGDGGFGPFGEDDCCG